MMMNVYLRMEFIGNDWHSIYVAITIAGRKIEQEGSSGSIPHHPVPPSVGIGFGGETTISLFGPLP